MIIIIIIINIITIIIIVVALSSMILCSAIISNSSRPQAVRGQRERPRGGSARRGFTKGVSYSIACVLCLLFCLCY